MSDKHCKYPAERIVLSSERDSNEGSEITITFSETSLNDTNFRDLRERSLYKFDEELFRCDEVVDEPKDLEELSPELKTILKENINRCSSKSKKPKFKNRCNFLKTFRCFSKRRRKTEKNKSESVERRKEKCVQSADVHSSFSESLVTPEKDIRTKRQLLDLYFYIIFLIFITTIGLSMVTSNMFYFSSITTSLFFDTTDNLNTDIFTDAKKTLRKCVTWEDFWDFAETTLLNLLYWNFYYSDLDPISNAENHDRKVLYGNQILGVARIRQVRVTKDSCTIHPNVQRFFNSCYFYYSIFTEDTDPILPDMENSSTATAWVYTEAKELGSSYYWGEVSIYGGGGYYLDLSTNKNDSTKMIRELKDNFWISEATRAVFIDFNIYNANANLFCICKIILEFPPVGGVIPISDFHSLKIIRYLRTSDFFILGCEFVYLLFVLYYTWETLKTLIRLKLSYFLLFWNYVDVIILLLSYLYVILSIVRHIYAKRLISSLSDRYNEYTEFHGVKTLQINFNNTIAVLLFFCWIKLFKYFNFNTILLEFKITLAKSLKDILGFFPMFLTLFLAFTFLAYLLFGNQVKTYNTLWLSFLTLLQAFLGEFYYTDIVESNPVLGPFFYVAYIFFIFFVLLNVFIAIINDEYTSVKSQVMYERPITGKYMKRGFVNIFTCGRGYFSKKQGMKETKKTIFFQKIVTALQKAGFSKAEINLFFHKYNINFKNFLEEDTKKRIVKDLELKRIDFSETSEQVQINTIRRRLDNLTNRMEDLEINLQPVLDKIDALFKRF